MDDAARIETLKSYLRRKYAADLVGLKALADTAVENATDPVTITGQTFEGGGHSGQITFEPMAYLAAVEAVIMELDPTAPLPGPDRTYVRFLHPTTPDPRFPGGGFC